MTIVRKTTEQYLNGEISLEQLDKLCIRDINDSQLVDLFSTDDESIYTPYYLALYKAQPETAKAIAKRLVEAIEQGVLPEYVYTLMHLPLCASNFEYPLWKVVEYSDKDCLQVALSELYQGYQAGLISADRITEIVMSKNASSQRLLDVAMDSSVQYTLVQPLINLVSFESLKLFNEPLSPDSDDQNKIALSLKELKEVETIASELYLSALTKNIVLFDYLMDQIQKKQLSPQQLRYIFLNPKVHQYGGNHRLVEVALSSGCSSIVRSTLKYLGFCALLPDARGITPLHTLVLLGNHGKELQVCLNEMFYAIEKGSLSPDIWLHIFLKTYISPKTSATTNLLSSSYLKESGSASQCVLFHIELAVKQGMLSHANYRWILLNHPDREISFSYLSDALSSLHYANVVAYVSANLQAVVNKIISMEDFRGLLMSISHSQSTLLQEVINKQKVESIELLLNLNRLFFPIALYKTLIKQTIFCDHISRKSMTHRILEREKITCENNDAILINSPYIVYFNKGKFNSLECDCINLLNQVTQKQSTLATKHILAEEPSEKGVFRIG